MADAKALLPPPSKIEIERKKILKLEGEIDELKDEIKEVKTKIKTAKTEDEKKRLEDEKKLLDERLNLYLKQLLQPVGGDWDHVLADAAASLTLSNDTPPRMKPFTDAFRRAVAPLAAKVAELAVDQKQTAAEHKQLSASVQSALVMSSHAFTKATTALSSTMTVMTPTTMTEVYDMFCSGNSKVPVVQQSWFPVPKEMPLNCKTLFSKDVLVAPQPEETVQEWFTVRLTKLSNAKGMTTCGVDTHKKTTLRGRCKPDFTGYRVQQPQNGFNTIWVGDVKSLEAKGGGGDSFSSAQKGHAVSFLMALLSDHSEQRAATGWLSDSNLIVFFRLIRDGEQLKLEESPVMYLHGDGGLWLVGLLSADCSLLDWSMPSISFKGEPATVTAVLGMGRTSKVYRAEYKSQIVVVKRFVSSARALHECTILKRIQPLNSVVNRTFCVPELVVDQPSDCGHFVVMTPVGIPFAITSHQHRIAISMESTATSAGSGGSGGSAVSAPSSSRDADSDSDDNELRVIARAGHMRAVIDALEQVHKLQLCHRDIGPSNCFALPLSPSSPASTILTLQNDWGSCADEKKDAPIETTRALASDRVLKAMPEPKSGVSVSDIKAVLDRPIPQDDLHSVVRTVWALEHPADFELISRAVSPAAVLDFWAKNLSSGTYQKMSAAADSCDYQRLRELVGDAMRA